MINKIKRLISSGFVKQALALSVGTAAAQAIPVIISPIISRIYTPSQLGVYSLFMSTVNITVQFSCLKYDMAITAAKDEKESSALFYICFLLSLIVSALTFLLLPFSGFLSALFKTDNSIWLYFLPLSTFLTGIFSALTSINIKSDYYNDVAKSNVIRSAVMAAVQITSVFILKNETGLIIGQVLSYFAGNLKLYKNIRLIIKNTNKSRKSVLDTAVKYSAYAKYTVAGSLANTCVYDTVSYFIAYFYGTQQLGYYSLVNRVLGLPLSVVSSAISQVYFKRANEEHENRQGKLFDDITILLAVISIPVFLIIFLVAKPAVVFIFGEDWYQAGQYIKILLPLFAVRFIISPVSTAAIAKGKQAQTMVWQMILLIISLLPAMISYVYQISIQLYLQIISIGLSAGYIVFYFYCRGLVK